MYAIIFEVIIIFQWAGSSIVSEEHAIPEEDLGHFNLGIREAWKRVIVVALSDGSLKYRHFSN